MTAKDSMSARWTRWMNRYHARRAGWSRAADGFVAQPEPRTIGRLSRGRQLCAGTFLIGGQLMEAPQASIWDVPAGTEAAEDERHGFTWLDDLAALGDTRAQALAQAWTADWLDRFGAGKGPGWTPALTGHRVVRLINHAMFLLSGPGKAMAERYFRSLGRQTTFLSRRWRGARHGLPRFAALSGLIYAGLSLAGLDRTLGGAVRALGRECATQIDPRGGLRSRSPEDLLEVFQLLIWARRALTESGHQAPAALLDAIERIAPTLRALRHSDGALARFHGGGRGLDGRLDQALAESGIRGGPRAGLAMGFARLHAARTSLIVDCAAPPDAAASPHGHASTLAFEMTSGRRPLIVSCGDGRQFGPAWGRAGRATASHSTLSIEGYSSARFGAARRGPDLLLDRPGEVKLQIGTEATAIGVVAGHDGYVPTHGLTHVRQLELSDDGRALAGEDMLAAIDDAHRDSFSAAMDRTQLRGIAYQIRFHLHPDVDASIDLGGTAVSMMLKSGEVWIFRHDGVADLGLEPSVYLEKDRLQPRATKQIVLSSRAVRYASRIRWTLAKAQDTPMHMRDFERDDSELTGS